MTYSPPTRKQISMTIKKTYRPGIEKTKIQQTMVHNNLQSTQKLIFHIHHPELAVDLVPEPYPPRRSPSSVKRHMDNLLGSCEESLPAYFEPLCHHLGPGGTVPEKILIAIF